MRYLITILLIIGASTVGILWLFKPAPQLATERVISVNKRNITSTELSPLFKEKQLDDQNIDDIINTVITRELLIQEAKRRKVDQEESFRNSLKNFYEQSLIKTLIDHESKAFSYSPSSEEIATYQKLLRKKVDISLIPVAKADLPEKDQKGKKEDLHVLFAELTPLLQMAVLSSQIGTTPRPLCYQDGQYAMQVNDITDAEDSPTMDLTNDEAKEAITSCRRDEYLKGWLEELENKADIKIDKDKL